MLDKIGIMQGRIIPENISKLQIFPISNWKEEINMTQSLGFTSIELLLDKDLHLRNILSNYDQRIEIGIHDRNSKQSFSAKSINLDVLSHLDFRTNREIFINLLEDFLSFSSNSSIETLVIPFCNVNTISSLKELIEVLDIFDEKDLDNKAKEEKIMLSIEVSNIGAKLVREAFSLFQFNNISVCFDLGNSIEHKFNPKDEIFNLGSLISHIHIKDKNYEGKSVMLGKGDVNFENSLKALIQINYKGQLILETPYIKNPVLEAESNRQYLVNILNNL